MSVVASGQISIIDLSDTKQLVSYIGSSQSKTIVYNPDTDNFIPDYTKQYQILTPQLFIAGTNNDLAKDTVSTRWFYQEDSAGAPIEILRNDTRYELGSGEVKTLIIKENVLESSVTMRYTCEMVYPDPNTGMDVTSEASIELVRIDSGKSSGEPVVAMVWTPEGNTLRNSEGALKASMVLYEGATEVVAQEYKWYIQDPTATTQSGGDRDGGDGWRKLTSSYNAGVTGYNSDTITIPASAIASLESFKGVAIYRNISYRDVVTVTDVTDPVLVIITGVNTFKNGQGHTEMTARLYRDGEEVDIEGNKYLYTWNIYDEDDILIKSFGEKGKRVTVWASDIKRRANLICEVSKR